MNDNTSRILSIRSPQKWSSGVAKVLAEGYWVTIPKHSHPTTIPTVSVIFEMGTLKLVVQSIAAGCSWFAMRESDVIGYCSQGVSVVVPMNIPKSYSARPGTRLLVVVPDMYAPFVPIRTDDLLQAGEMRLVGDDPAIVLRLSELTPCSTEEMNAVLDTMAKGG